MGIVRCLYGANRKVRPFPKPSHLLTTGRSCDNTKRGGHGWRAKLAIAYIRGGAINKTTAAKVWSVCGERVQLMEVVDDPALHGRRLWLTHEPQRVE